MFVFYDQENLICITEWHQIILFEVICKRFDFVILA